MTGLIAPGFEAVGAAFATDPRGGSALTILRNGEPVVDIREGWRDAARTIAWDARTLVNVYSVGKPVIAAALLILEQRGLVALPAPAATYWPSFQAPASVRDLLAHLGGLPSFSPVRGEPTPGPTGICSAPTWPRPHRNGSRAPSPPNTH